MSSVSSSPRLPGTSCVSLSNIPGGFFSGGFGCISPGRGADGGGAGFGWPSSMRTTRPVLP